MSEVLGSTLNVMHSYHFDFFAYIKVCPSMNQVCLCTYKYEPGLSGCILVRDFTVNILVHSTIWLVVHAWFVFIHTKFVLRHTFNGNARKSMYSVVIGAIQSHSCTYYALV